MSYSKIEWKDAPDTSTPVNAANLNKMDTQIALNDTNISSINSTMDTGDIPSALSSTGKVGEAIKNLNSTCAKSSALATVATSGKYTDLSNRPSLATVATSGSYNDLSNKPTKLPASDVSDWAKASSKPSYNYSEIIDTPTKLPASDVKAWAKADTKPSYTYSEIDGRPTKLSEFTNDSGYITSSGSCKYATSAGSADKATTATNATYATSAGSATDSSKLPLAGGTMTGAISMNGNGIVYYGNNRIFANEQDLNLIGAGKSSSAGYINARVSVAFQVRNTENTAFAPCYASNISGSSSIRYKENVEDMTEERAKEILNLRPVTFDYKDKESGTDCMGLIAEEVETVDKFPVYYNNSGEVEGIVYDKFVPALIKMIQIQQKEIDELKEKIK